MNAPDTTQNSAGDAPAAGLSVLFIWEAPEALREYLRGGLSAWTDIRLTFADDLTPERLIEQASDSDVIVGWRPPEGLLAAAERLRLWINPGAGVRHLVEPFRELNDSRAAAGKTTVLLANGHGNTYFTAQHAVALLLALLNRVVPHHNWMAAGLWRRGDGDAKSIPLRGQRVGILGYGSIGAQIHRFLSGFDLTFGGLRLHWDRLSTEPPTPLTRYGPDALHDFLRASDILFITLPHTDRTEGLLGAAELALLGPQGLLVNVARGTVVQEQALYEALRDRQLAGAALDVWYDYRPQHDALGRLYPFSLPFHELENVVLSPHRAASPFDNLQRWDEVIENIARLAQGQSDLLNIVDLAAGY